jgi:hypothetical protein
MMSASFATFFWLSAIFFYLKYAIALPDWLGSLFLIIIVLFMYFINVGIMQTKCGSASGSVIQATLVPWLCMFLPMMVALHFFPTWKNPFSNTVGYMIARIAGGTNALLALLKQGSEVKLHYVYNDPSLLLNQFTPANFEVVLDSYKDDMDYTEEKKQAFLRIVQLKDTISEWIWYLLTASVVISTSYSMMMQGECTKSADEYVLSHQVAMAETKPTVTQRVYTVTE